MVGAGVFYVWAPAAELAGSWILVALGVAGLVAVLNAISMAQLAVAHPVSGGGYAYAKLYLSPGVGFVSGFLFLAGKTASVAAIALIAANHVLPDYAPLTAAGLIVVFAAINISGVRSTAGVSLVIAVIVVGALLTMVGSTGGGNYPVQWSAEDPPSGVLGAAALMFFAFAGYARMATMGAEIRSPQRVLPWVIVGTIVGVVALYSLVGWFVVSQLGIEALAASATPVADAVGEPWKAALGAIAVLAALGSLMTILAGLSRTALAMAEGHDAPPLVGYVGPKTGTPVVAEALMAVIAIVVVFAVDPFWLVSASSGSVLTYYAIAHLSALQQPASERFVPRVVQVAGLVGCVALVVALPAFTLVTSAVLLGVSMVLWWGVVKPRQKLG
jgi:APA family basic amino acid/polyamine antiporter